MLHSLVFALCLLCFLWQSRSVQCRSTGRESEYNSQENPEGRCLQYCLQKTSSHQTCFQKCQEKAKEDKMVFHDKSSSISANLKVLNPLSIIRRKRSSSGDDSSRLCPKDGTGNNTEAVVKAVERKQYENSKTWYLNISWYPVNEESTNFTGYAFIFFYFDATMTTWKYIVRQKNETYVVFNESVSGWSYEPREFYFTVIARPCLTGTFPFKDLDDYLTRPSPTDPDDYLTTPSPTMCPKGKILTRPTGVIESPLFPRVIQNCSWQITAAPGNHVLLMIPRTLAIKECGSPNQCSCDLQVQNGFSAEWKGTICSSTSGLIKFYSTHESLKVVLVPKYTHSKSNRNNMDAFTATYIQLPYSPPICPTEAIPLDGNGKLSSPYYPMGNYSASSNCSWIITVPSDKKVKFAFTELALGSCERQACSSGNCTYVELYDGASTSSPRLRRFCNGSVKQVVFSSGNQMFVRFRSGSSLDRGFEAQYSVPLGRPTTTTLSQTVTTVTAPTSPSLEVSPSPTKGTAMTVGIAILASMSAIGTLILIIRIAYRFRRKCQMPSSEAEMNVLLPDFCYDVFIIFSNKDQHWVDETLLPILELDNGLKCCVHYRDFEPGRPFVQNMTDSVQNSRNTIAVVSENFFNSEYCQFELEQAIYRHVTDGYSRAIVIKIDNVSKDKLPDALKNKSFVDYANLIERKTWHLKLIKVLTSSVRY